MSFRELEEGRDIRESPLADVGGGTGTWQSGRCEPTGKAKKLRMGHLRVCLFLVLGLVVKRAFVIVNGIIVQRIVSDGISDQVGREW